MEKIITERSNKKTENIDTASTIRIVELINNEDKRVAQAIRKQKRNIAKAIDLIANKFQQGGRLLYFGAGTSGRLGVLDASECPPTFGVEPDMVQGFIAGGDSALRTAIEGAEDSEEFAKEDYKKAAPTSNDVVAAISASGNPKYLLKILELARKNGVSTVSAACNKDAKIKKFSDIFICPIVGEEVVSGSTRMKSGTAQKMILNMLTTGAMIKIGKTYKNYMIDVKATNEKLKTRAIRIVSELGQVSEETALKTLEKSDRKVKTAVVMLWFDIDKEAADKLLKKHNGVLRKLPERVNS